MKTMKAERSIVIAADRERVWRAITTPEHISKWFDGTMRWSFTLAVGETITLTMDDFTDYARIAAVEPPERFAFYWTAEPDNPAETLVTFTLESVPEGTRVTASEEGFEALPEDLRHKRYDMNSMGWDMALDSLGAYLRENAT
jgi:uncharacterized protein YndB with AHSA1/START domain